MPIRRVLPDEEYEEQLESIINRDFYPRLKRLREQQRAATLAPSTLGPSTRSSDNQLPNPNALPLSLDAFQATHINQDDLSFARIVELDNQQRRARLAWMLESSEHHNRRIENLKADLDTYESLDVGGQLLGGDDYTRLQELGSLNGGVITNRHEPTTRLLGGAASSSDDILAIQGPGPLKLAIEHTSARSSHLALETVGVSAPKPLIMYPSTRFGEDDSEEEDFLASVQKNAQDEADKYQAAEIVRAVGDRAVAQGSFRDPKVRETIPGIEKTPMVLPETPMMTWGTISATPIAVLDEETPEYNIPASSSRDEIAHGLHDTKVQKQRAKTRSALSLKEELQELHQTRTRPITQRNKQQRTVLDTPLARELSKRVLGSKTGRF